MDPLAGLLDGPRARGAFVLRSIMNPPWSVRVQDEAPLSLVAMVRGDAWVVPDDDDDAVHLGAGDIAITRGPDPYVFADDPGTPPQVVIHPGRALHDARRQGSRADDGSRRPHVGQRSRRLHDHAHRHLPRPRRDQSPAPARASRPGRAAARHVGLATGSAARSRDRERRARPGGRPRPSPRSAAHRGAAGVVLASGGGGTSVVPREQRSDRRARAAHAAEQPGAPVDRRVAGSRNRCVARRARRVGSPTSSASRR